MEEFVKTGKTVCILINKQGRIYYSNIGKDVAEKCLEDIHIFDHLPADGTVSYNVGYTLSLLIRLIWMRHATI